jgi:hypothetical protein
MADDIEVELPSDQVDRWLKQYIWPSWLAELLSLLFALFQAGTGFVFIIFAVVVRGFVLSKLWGWFVASTFNVPTIGIAQAIGIAMMLSLASNSRPPQPKDWPRKITMGMFWKGVGESFMPLSLLVVGWILAQFIGE